MAAGVSSYCIRVALGSLLIHVPRGKPRKHDHYWVMYQNESGVWEILEPTVLVERKALVPAAQDVTIEPYPTEYVVEVGTPVARRPPHRSRRAVFPHLMWRTT